MSWYLGVLKKYATFDGRARRMEYWMFVLINLIVTFLIGFADGALHISGTPGRSMIANLYQLAVLIPTIAVGVRRMHDTDHSGWWLLIPLVNLFFAVSDGTQGSNRFGPDPKGA